MRRPKPKARSVHIPTLWRTALTTALRAEYHGRRYDDAAACPACGATTWHRVGWTSRLFALLIVDDNDNDDNDDDVEKDTPEVATQQSASPSPTAPRRPTTTTTTTSTTTTTHAFEPIRVFLQRYRCRQCGAYFTATGPFYPHIMYGAPIVDLALYLASANPFNRVERILMSLGVQVDRHTVQNWVRLYGDRVKHRAGISLAGSVLGINIVKLLFGVENVAQLRRAHPELAPILTGVADETYPAKKGAKKALREDNARRKAQGKKPRRFPESFTVATSYVPQVETYAAIQVTDVPFTSLHAAVVLKPLAGVDLLCVDGHAAYDLVDHVHCAVHEARNRRKKSPEWKQLKNDPNITPSRRRAHARQFYETVLAERRAEVAARFPRASALVATRPGVVTTNAIEGANWRLKFELRVPYRTTASLWGRVALHAIEESTKTFRRGAPHQSPGARWGQFQYREVMMQHLEGSSRRGPCNAVRWGTKRLEWDHVASVSRASVRCRCSLRRAAAG